MNLRSGIRGPWLGCSAFPKCRGRMAWNKLDEPHRKRLEEQLHAHDKANPVPVIRTLEGRPLTDAKGKPLPDAPTVDALTSGASGNGNGADRDAERADEEPLESVA
jgi:DNA topoisomerase-1